jgi:hypothetical protein
VLLVQLVVQRLVRGIVCTSRDRQRHDGGRGDGDEKAIESSHGGLLSSSESDRRAAPTLGWPCVAARRVEPKHGERRFVAAVAAERMRARMVIVPP